MRRQLVGGLGLAIVATVLVSCTRPPETPPGGEAAPPTATPEETLPPLSPAPPGATSGQPSQGCVSGWRTPERGSRQWEKPLRVIRRAVGGLRGRFEVVDMRYFEGPEAPPSDKGYILVIRRWYVKGYLRGDDTFRGRWLVESRRFGSGVVAVAPYDTRGFESPDWTGFQWETAGEYAEPREYPGLPGEWVGTPYDFVEGQEDATSESGEGLQNRGLPEEVEGCLEGA